MEFTLENIQAAHQKYTGKDFPKLVALFKAMGMESNTFSILEGVVVYRHKNGETIIIKRTPVDAIIPETADVQKAITDLKRHQQGETEFTTFSKEIAEDGIVEWITRMEESTCSYYDRGKNAVIVENIPIMTVYVD